MKSALLAAPSVFTAKSFWSVLRLRPARKVAKSEPRPVRSFDPSREITGFVGGVVAGVGRERSLRSRRLVEDQILTADCATVVVDRKCRHHLSPACALFA